MCFKIYVAVYDFLNVLFIHIFAFFPYAVAAAAAAKSLQSCLTLCDPIGGSPPGSSIPGIHLIPHKNINFDLSNSFCLHFTIDKSKNLNLFRHFSSPVGLLLLQIT